MSLLGKKSKHPNLSSLGISVFQNFLLTTNLLGDTPARFVNQLFHSYRNERSYRKGEEV